VTDPIDVLLIGSGGREHALAWKLRQSPRLGKLFAAPGNPGIGEVAELAPLDVADPGAVAVFCRRQGIGLCVIGPEGPLVDGLVDGLGAAGIPAFGPTAAAAQLEGSKGYTKDLCADEGIPTAAYRRFADPAAAKTYVEDAGAPIVVKADGLAAGKGVTVAETLGEALAAVDACFATPGAEVVIEERLTGVEASLFAISDGTDVIPFGSAQDYKRAGDGDTGPNTGGMGAVSPAPALAPALEARALEEIVRPTVRAMAARGAPFRGVLYAGLMLTENGPKLIEFNVRFGDPECQVLMTRLDGDLLPVLLAAAEGRLGEVEAPRWSSDSAVTVVMAARGYPGPFERGTAIGAIEAADALPATKVFHAGTAREADGRLVASGGRVLNVTARGSDVAKARARAYAGVAAIDWPGGFYRSDIGG
jgi:phosphoribosylamine--glycine ligase